MEIVVKRPIFERKEKSGTSQNYFFKSKIFVSR